MYEFKQHINNTQRYNTYELYGEEIDEPSSYFTLKNGLILIAILIITIASIFAFNSYKQGSLSSNSNNYVKTYIHQKISPTAQDEYTHLQLTQAISKSIVHNLQSKRTLETLSDDELKSIIKSVVKKIEKNPKKLNAKEN